MGIEDTIREREERYGGFRNNARIAQSLKGAVRGGPTWAHLSPGRREAIDQILSKISREVCGDGEYQDNMLDIEGYARLARTHIAGPYEGIEITTLSDEVNGVRRYLMPDGSEREVVEEEEDAD